MALFSNLFGKNSHLADRFERLASSIEQRARQQASERGLDFVTEAQKVGSMCGIQKKRQHPGNFIDIALVLLSYPVELACLIAHGFKRYEQELGYNPYGKIMVALSCIESFYQGMIFKTSTFDESPDLFELVSSKEERIRRSGRLLAVNILFVDELADARLRYRTACFDESVRVEVDMALAAFDSEISKAIIRGSLR